MNPCYKCVERIFGCHAGCSKYNEWQKEHIAEIKKIRSEKKKEQELLDEPFRAIERSRK